jgi:hypothetical protein
MSLSDLFKNDLAIAIAALCFGSFLTFVIGKLSGKTSTLRYSCRIDRVAVSATDEVFGEVSVTWKGSAVRNLYTAVIELENTTSIDFENVPFKIYTGDSTILLGERTAVLDTPYIVNWSDAFRSQLAVTSGNAPTPEQWGVYNHSREYTIPVFNRGQKIQFAFICSCPNTDELPGIFLSTLYPAMKLKYQPLASFVLGVPVHIAAPRGLIVTLITVGLCGILIDNAWLAAAISAVVGLSAQIFGSLLYKAQRWLFRAISGWAWPSSFLKFLHLRRVELK